MDYFLQPYSVGHRSYIKDTYDFIAKVRDHPIEKDWLLLSADVEALYTNMKLERILSTCREAFRERYEPQDVRPLLILELLETILYGNDFEFDNQHYLQLCGTPMGRKFSPSTANIYLRHFDDQAMGYFRIKPTLYFRFLDDIFNLWPGTEEEAREYENFLNTLIPGIKITLTIRNYIIEFLDTQVYKFQNPDGSWVLKTRTYCKPTDTHQLLHTSSFHPKHPFTGILKSQYIRFKRIFFV